MWWAHSHPLEKWPRGTSGRQAPTGRRYGGAITGHTSLWGPWWGEAPCPLAAAGLRSCTTPGSWGHSWPGHGDQSWATALLGIPAPPGLRGCAQLRPQPAGGARPEHRPPPAEPGRVGSTSYRAGTAQQPPGRGAENWGDPAPSGEGPRREEGGTAEGPGHSGCGGGETAGRGGEGDPAAAAAAGGGVRRPSTEAARSGGGGERGPRRFGTAESPGGAGSRAARPGG